MTALAPSSSVPRPRILVLAILQMQHEYDRELALINFLSEDAEVFWARQSDEATLYLQATRPLAIIFADHGFLLPDYDDVSYMVQAYASTGGRIIFSNLFFSRVDNIGWITAAFASFNFPWTIYSTTARYRVRLSPTALVNTPGVVHDYSSCVLEGCMFQTIDPSVVLYRPESGVLTWPNPLATYIGQNSLDDPAAMELPPSNVASVIWAPLPSNGYIGVIGVTDRGMFGQMLTDQITHMMCGLVGAQQHSGPTGFGSEQV